MPLLTSPHFSTSSSSPDSSSPPPPDRNSSPDVGRSTRTRTPQTRPSVGRRSAASALLRNGVPMLRRAQNKIPEDVELLLTAVRHDSADVTHPDRFHGRLRVPPVTHRRSRHGKERFVEDRGLRSLVLPVRFTGKLLGLVQKQQRPLNQRRSRSRLEFDHVHVYRPQH